MSRDISVHELHTHTDEVLQRVEAGEHVRVMRDDGDRPIAELAPVAAPADETGPQTWVPRERLIGFPLADPGMRDDLAAVYEELGGH
jgi:antitoxin (DNA-binding transcriptional repressor) of toxin-antitoxin stability system